MSKYTVCRQEWKHFPKVLVVRNDETSEERRYVPESGMRVVADANDKLREMLHLVAEDRRYVGDMSIRLKVENSRLRKLCKMFAEYVSQDSCEGCCCKCRCRDGLIDECWMLTNIRELASELEIEVD